MFVLETSSPIPPWVSVSGATAFLFAIVLLKYLSGNMVLLGDDSYLWCQQETPLFSCAPACCSAKYQDFTWDDVMHLRTADFCIACSMPAIAAMKRLVFYSVYSRLGE